MKPGRVFLDELNSNSKAYKVKVKVIEKGRARTSPHKRVVYQNVLLEDDKGNRMRGALFGDQVEGYKDAFVYNGVYEISNAPIKPCDAQWKSNQSNLDFQMTFGRQTVIQPIETQTGPIIPQYQNINQLPKVVNGDEKFDVLGIVIYMETKARKVTTSQQRELFVREIVVVDHSVEHPLIISAWNDLAENDCESLSSWTKEFQIVGFTALKVSTHKGFSLTTTMSTMIIHSPEGERAASLKEWASRHPHVLVDMQSRVLDTKRSGDERIIKRLSTLKMKRAQNTLQEERHWLRVTIPELDFEKINAYLGCSNCGKRAEMPEGHVYSCSSCSKKDSKCTPKVTFNCEVSDGSGTLAITSFTDDTQQLFRMTAGDIFRMKHSDDHETFDKLQKLLQTTHFLIQVGPKATLSRNNILQWVLKKIITNEEEHCATDNETSKTKNTQEKTAEVIATKDQVVIASEIMATITSPPDHPAKDQQQFEEEHKTQTNVPKVVHVVTASNDVVGSGDVAASDNDN